MGSWCRGMPWHQLTDPAPNEFPDLVLHYLMRLARPYGGTRVDAASLRALEIGARNYGAVKSILEKKLDGEPLRRPRTAGEVGIDHPNIRGPKYYH